VLQRENDKLKAEVEALKRKLDAAGKQGVKTGNDT
jgi:hypothetical protein